MGTIIGKGGSGSGGGGSANIDDSTTSTSSTWSSEKTNTEITDAASNFFESGVQAHVAHRTDTLANLLLVADGLEGEIAVASDVNAVVTYGANSAPTVLTVQASNKQMYKTEFTQFLLSNTSHNVDVEFDRTIGSADLAMHLTDLLGSPYTIIALPQELEDNIATYHVTFEGYFRADLSGATVKISIGSGGHTQTFERSANSLDIVDIPISGIIDADWFSLNHNELPIKIQAANLQAPTYITANEFSLTIRAERLV